MKVWTDGSCIGNPGPGGWAVVFPHTEYYGYDPDTTNNRMELTAIIQAVNHTPRNTQLTIITDSQWCINMLTSIWKARTNLDLIGQYNTLVDTMTNPPKLLWVKSHSGNTHNERADVLANACAHGYLEPKTA